MRRSLKPSMVATYTDGFCSSTNEERGKLEGQGHLGIAMAGVAPSWRSVEDA